MIEYISNNFELFITVFTVTTVLLNIFNHWYISQGKMNYVYPFSMGVYFCYIIVETSLAIRHPEQWSILLYNFTNVYALTMAYRGHRRLGKLSKEKHPEK